MPPLTQIQMWLQDPFWRLDDKSNVSTEFIVVSILHVISLYRLYFLELDVPADDEVDYDVVYDTQEVVDLGIDIARKGVILIRNDNQHLQRADLQMKLQALDVLAKGLSGNDYRDVLRVKATVYREYIDTLNLSELHYERNCLLDNNRVVGEELILHNRHLKHNYVVRMHEYIDERISMLARPGLQHSLRAI